MARRTKTLRDLMTAAGLGPWQLAEAARCSPNSIRQALDGVRKIQVRTAKKIAKALGVEIQVVLDAAEASRVAGR